MMSWLKRWEMSALAHEDLQKAQTAFGKADAEIAVPAKHPHFNGAEKAERSRESRVFREFRES